ncbi:riboflavin biosynthesis protein RibF [Ruminococcaceae bacterium OttesenSCG-928-D13]|nr:riboflavin biosynthesis protein RibF [Ruminococcaceae bacterium OttesenSCG-928-D13]
MRVVDLRQGRGPEDTPCAIALGLFDGVHLGHRAVIGKAAEIAARRGLRLAVFTFPWGRKAVRPILTLDEKHAQLAALWVDTCYEPPFESFKTLSPEDFFTGMLLGEYNAKAVVCGENFGFGAKRAGNTTLLKALGAEHRVELAVAGLTLYDGQPISSSRIREALADGQMENVNAMLGRTYALAAPVGHGKRLGSTLGFPTLNQTFPEGVQAPALGVYATRTMVGGRAWPSVTGWGTRPTVDTAGSPTCETFIPGFEGDLYGDEVTVEFHKKIADSQRFDGPQALAAAVQSWAAEAAAYFQKSF